MKTVEGIAEPLSASVRPDLRPAGIGACTCPPGTNYAACECEWGLIITRMFQLGYGRDATPALIAQQVQNLADAVRDTTRTARLSALRTLARDWVGAVTGLARMVGMTHQRLQKLVPDVYELVAGAQHRAGVRSKGRPIRPR